MSLPNPMSLFAQQTDVQSYKVLIDGEAISGEVPVQTITVQKLFNRIATAKIEIFDGNVTERDFPLSNKDTFKPGNEIEIQLGYHNETKTVFKGIIVRHRLKAGRDGSTHLFVEAKDEALKLTTARRSAYFFNKKDSEIIELLAGEAGLEVEVEDTPVTHEEMVQYNCSDWDFIVSRAEMNGMMVLASNNKLTLKKPQVAGEPVYVATFGENIFEFEAELDARRQLKKVESAAWNYADQQTERSAEGSASFSEAGDLSADDLADVLESEIILRHAGNLAGEQLDAWSNAYTLRSKLSKICGRVRVQGVAEPPTGLAGLVPGGLGSLLGGEEETAIKPGDVIELKGVGDKFNGKVLVTGVLHQFGGNWTTDLQFGWAEEWFHQRDDVVEAPAAGLLPGVRGLQIGKVVNVDDTQGEFRVQVKMPLVNNDEDGTWARVATLDAGSNRGTFYRPLEGDEVVLGFLNDDPRDAVVLGCLHSSNKASPLPNGQKQYGYVSENGLKLIFDDDNKSIELTDGTNSIKIESSGITIEGTNVNVK